MINTQGTNKRIREIIHMVRNGSLIPRPEFQRRLVWTSKDKDFFIDTVLRGYPFPEIYIANGDVDIDTGEGTQLLVDGLQRVNTLVEYFSGDSNFTHVHSKPYRMLDDLEKKRFLEYSIVVRDLGAIEQDQIVAVFKRLNSTQYSLRDMEINNAIYNGSLKKFCEMVADHKIFEENKVFTATDRRRMGDVAFCLTLIGTIIIGYFNRDSEHENLLSRYNEDFPQKQETEERLNKLFDFLEECGFPPRSRIWKKADFFTAAVELDHALHVERLALEPSFVLDVLSRFFDALDAPPEQIHEIYYKAALQASNDRGNRLRRSIIVRGLIAQKSTEETIEELLVLKLI